MSGSNRTKVSEMICIRQQKLIVLHSNCASIFNIERTVGEGDLSATENEDSIVNIVLGKLRDLEKAEGNKLCC